MNSGGEVDEGIGRCRRRGEEMVGGYDTFEYVKYVVYI